MIPTVASLPKSQELIDEILAKRKTELASKINRFPRNQAILSDIVECDRQMVYGVLNWQDRQMFTEEIQARLDAGNVQEKEIVNMLIRLGFNVILSQMPVEIKGRSGRVIARGKIDGMIRFGDKKIPFEIKSMNPNIFNQMNSLDDFQKKPYLRKYIRQIQMYLFGNNLDEGFLILTDCLGHIKMIQIFLDYEECETIMQQLERVDEAISKKEYPDRISYNPEICDKCPFSLICLQNITPKPADLIVDSEIEMIIARHEELKPLAKEFDELHEKIKIAFNGVEKALVGDKFLVQNMPSFRTAYELPDDVKQNIEDIKKPYAKKAQVNRLLIQNLGTNP